MKNLKFVLIIFILLAISLISCTDNPLQETPKDFLADENFWQTEEDALLAVRGMYGPFKPKIWGWQAINLHQEYTKGRGSWASMSNWDRPLDATQLWRIDLNWENDYMMINRVNNVLANVSDIEFKDESLKTSYLAEAYFIRAWAYFELVRAYGPVPLRLEPSTGANIHAPRESEDVIYQQIINDLQIAEAGLPKSVGSKTGRASAGAAKLLLASVYLTMENWQQAASKAEEVINMNDVYSLVEVTESDDFYNIFAIPANPEEIFAIHYSQETQDGLMNTFHRANIPRWNNSSSGFYTTLPVINENQPTILAPESWDEGDLRQNFNLYRDYEDGQGELVPLPSSSPVLFKKFIKDPNGLATHSRPLFRYAEAFLIYAEAAAMAAGGPTPMALEQLNVIKRRSHGYDLFSASPVDYPSGMSLEEFRNVIVRERGQEFINEYRRWWDLKRWGLVEETILSATGLQVHSSRILWPLPQAEIDNNDEITPADQNPGY